MNEIKIHFVGRGNICRERLAEAYFKSRVTGDWEVSSSGIDTSKYYPNTYLSPWCRTVGMQRGFGKWFSIERVQTTSELLQQADIIVFMSQDVYRDAKKRYDFNSNASVVWHIRDRKSWKTPLHDSKQQEYTFQAIKRNVDQLIRDVTRGGWVDIVDEQNNDLGYRLPIGFATKQGLWHRGGHVIITTPDKRTIVQKRSSRIVFSPNYLDVTLGGHLDPGESPEQAILRETEEELGLKLQPKNLRLLEICRHSSYHPRYKSRTKVIVYTFHASLADNNPAFALQDSEVAAVYMLPRRKLKRLLRYHRLKSLGRLNYAYKYYERIAKQAGIYSTNAK